MTQKPVEVRAQTPHRVIAERVRELRKRRGWSGQRLGEELTAVGVSWDRSIVANFENGRRPAVSVEEWLALAYVLGVAPVHLLVPVEGMEDYEVVPGEKVSPEVGRAWVRGLHAIGDPRSYFSDVPKREFGIDITGTITPAMAEVMGKIPKGSVEG